MNLSGTFFGFRIPFILKMSCPWFEAAHSATNSRGGVQFLILDPTLVTVSSWVWPWRGLVLMRVPGSMVSRPAEAL